MTSPSRVQPPTISYDANPAYGVLPCDITLSSPNSELVQEGSRKSPAWNSNNHVTTANLTDRSGACTSTQTLNSVDQPLPAPLTTAPATDTQFYDYPYPEPAAATTSSQSTVVPAVAPPSYQVSVGAAGSVAFVAAPVKPDYPGAHTFIVLAVTVTITCAIFNPLSLFFGVPALALAVLTLKYKYKNEDYPKAKNYGRCSFIFSLITVIFTLICILVIVGTTTGLLTRCRYLWIRRNSDPQCLY